MKAGKAKIGIFQKMRIKNLRGASEVRLKKNSTLSPWKRRKTTSSVTFCATSAWGLTHMKFKCLMPFEKVFIYDLKFIKGFIRYRIRGSSKATRCYFTRHFGSNKSGFNFSISPNLHDSALSLWLRLASQDQVVKIWSWNRGNKFSTRK